MGKKASRCINESFGNDRKPVTNRNVDVLEIHKAKIRG